MNTRSLEQILSVEFRLMTPSAFYISPDLNRLIDAGWAWKRMSLHGYWVMGFTAMGQRAH